MMKRVFVISFLLLFLWVGLFAQAEKPTLAILDVAGEGIEQSRTDLVYEYIIDKVNRTGNYTKNFIN